MTNLLANFIDGFEGEKQNLKEQDEEPEPERKLQEIIRYYVDFHDSLVNLEGKLHDVEDISMIVREAIQAAYDYYDADWAGILVADSITKMWSPVMWLSRRTGWNNKTLFDEYEVFENYPRWVESLRTGKPLIIEDVDQVEDLSERERFHYQKLRVQGVIGAPFGERPTGFMVIKNPRRYKTNADFAKMIAFVGLSTLYLDELLKGIEMTRKSDKLSNQSEKCVHINLFGVPEIQTEYGRTDATQYKSQQGWELITYLALVRKPVPSKQIAETLWPDEDLKNKTEAVRGIRYRFIKNLDYLQIKDILKSSDTKQGYEVNPEIPVVIDVWEFADLIQKAKVTNDVLKKIELLKSAVSLYHGSIFQDIGDKDWLMSYALEYDAMYENAVMELLEYYDKTGDYISMHHFTLYVLEYLPENPELYYWMMRALAGIGSKGVMKKQMEQIETHLSEEEYAELKGKLGEEFNL
ncbi:MAG: BTAD domain-containing putative transcriptional regulator [Eubacteriales bacterium]|nr:BTAD domain-containing putative transcriptional regulator [Eubacteriales bacterium]